MQTNQQVVIKIMNSICVLLIAECHSAVAADFVVGGNPLKESDLLFKLQSFNISEYC